MNRPFMQSKNEGINGPEKGAFHLWIQPEKRHISTRILPGKRHSCPEKGTVAPPEPSIYGPSQLLKRLLKREDKRS